MWHKWIQGKREPPAKDVVQERRGWGLKGKRWQLTLMIISLDKLNIFDETKSKRLMKIILKSIFPKENMMQLWGWLNYLWYSWKTSERNNEKSVDKFLLKEIKLIVNNWMLFFFSLNLFTRITKWLVKVPPFITHLQINNERKLLSNY